MEKKSKSKSVFFGALVWISLLNGLAFVCSGLYELTASHNSLLPQVGLLTGMTIWWLVTTLLTLPSLFVMFVSKAYTQIYIESLIKKTTESFIKYFPTLLEKAEKELAPKPLYEIDDEPGNNNFH